MCGGQVQDLGPGSRPVTGPAPHQLGARCQPASPEQPHGTASHARTILSALAPSPPRLLPPLPPKDPARLEGRRGWVAARLLRSCVPSGAAFRIPLVACGQEAPRSLRGHPAEMPRTLVRARRPERRCPLPLGTLPHPHLPCPPGGRGLCLWEGTAGWGAAGGPRARRQTVPWGRFLVPPAIKTEIYIYITYTYLKSESRGHVGRIGGQEKRGPASQARGCSPAKPGTAASAVSNLRSASAWV